MDASISQRQSSSILQAVNSSGKSQRTRMAKAKSTRACSSLPLHLKDCCNFGYAGGLSAQLLNPVQECSAQLGKLKQEFTPEFLSLVWPMGKPPTIFAGMNVEETAIWIYMLAGFKGWNNATIYSNAFKAKEISGKMFQYISIQTLVYEVGIVLLDHCYEIIAAIENKELTMMNPVVVLRPRDNHPTKTFGSSSHQRMPRREWRSESAQEKAISKWCSTTQRKPINSTNTNKSVVPARLEHPLANMMFGPGIYCQRIFPNPTSPGSWSSRVSPVNLSPPKPGYFTGKKSESLEGEVGHEIDGLRSPSDAQHGLIPELFVHDEIEGLRSSSNSERGTFQGGWE